MPQPNVAGPHCEDCGEPVEPDPAGSLGVWVHSRELGDHAYDQDEDHTARPPEFDDAA